jgi:RNA polymerase sigma factor (sigma-70 family)
MARLTLIPGGKSTVERFEALIGRHYQLLYRTAYRFTRSVPDAEDLVQEVCVRAYARLDELEQLDQPHSWLLCVMRRIFIDQLRRFDRTHVESIEMHDTAAFAADGPGPSEQTESALWTRKLDRAWQRLDEDQRALLALHDVEGYTLAELMEMTGLKEGTLKSRLHRARARLGKLMRQEDGVSRSASTGAGGHR